MAVTLPSTFLQLNPSLPSRPLNKVVANGAKASRSNTGYSINRISCRKKDLHPEFYEDAKVYCNGELVMTTGGTQKEYVVDVWSGNHPFYLGNRSAVLVDADQVEKFRKKFGELSEIMQIPVLKGENPAPLPKRSRAGKGKKK